MLILKKINFLNKNFVSFRDLRKFLTKKNRKNAKMQKDYEAKR